MTPKTSTAHTLRLTRLINAAPEKVFRAWTEPKHLREWSAPEKYSVVIAEVDLKVGGKYRIRMQSPEGTTHTAFGSYREVTRPKKLVYTWSWEEEGDHDIGETVVTVEFKARGSATEVIVTHDGFPTADDRTNHEQGWTSCLGQLEQLF